MGSNLIHPDSTVFYRLKNHSFSYEQLGYIRPTDYSWSLSYLFMCIYISSHHSLILKPFLYILYNLSLSVVKNPKLNYSQNYDLTGFSCINVQWNNNRLENTFQQLVDITTRICQPLLIKKIDLSFYFLNV